jgi:hypothetical protein
VHIFSFLTIRELAVIPRVNKQFRLLASNDVIWHAYYVNEWNNADISKLDYAVNYEEMNWKAKFEFAQRTVYTYLNRFDNFLEGIEDYINKFVGILQQHSYQV